MTHINFAGLSHEDTLEDLGQVPQVEGVMGLGWRGQQAGADRVVHRDRRQRQLVAVA